MRVFPSICPSGVCPGQKSRTGPGRPQTGPGRPQTGPRRPQTGPRRPPTGPGRPLTGPGRPWRGPRRPRRPHTGFGKPQTGFGKPQMSPEKPLEKQDMGHGKFVLCGSIGHQTLRGRNKAYFQKIETECIVLCLKNLLNYVSNHTLQNANPLCQK